MKSLLNLTLPALFVLGVITCASPARAADDIVDTAVKAGSFKTLATALQKAELVAALKGEGPFTVFAPTDDAFAKLPKETLADLLKPENKEKLTAILTYHVVKGKVMSDKVVDLKEAETLNGKKVKIEVKDGAVLINTAKVVKADVAASNGVIHVIDAVLLPPADAAKPAAAN